MPRVIDVAQAQREPEPIPSEVAFDVQKLTVGYRGQTAITDVDLQIYRNVITAVIGPSGCGKSTFIRCLNRMNDLVPGAVIEGRVLYGGENLYAPGVDPVEVRRRIGMVFQKANPVPEVDLRQRRVGPARARHAEEPRRARREGAPRRSALGRGQRQAEEECAVALRRTAAAVVHRAGDCRGARSAAARRAGLGARPDRDVCDRRAHARAQEGLHPRHRHAQHAAGGAGRRPDRLLQPRRRGRPENGRARRVRRDEQGLHQSVRRRTEDYVTGRFG